jgi:large subunit ribosomal protein L9
MATPATSCCLRARLCAPIRQQAPALKPSALCSKPATTSARAKPTRSREKLDGKTFVVVRSAGETGQLYGSVAARDVIAVLEENGFTIGRSQVDLNNPIKTIGLHTVPLALHADVNVEVTFNVARSADEAERQAKGEDLSSADAIYGIDEEAAAEAAEAAANDPDYLDDEDGEGEENA